MNEIHIVTVRIRSKIIEILAKMQAEDVFAEAAIDVLSKDAIFEILKKMTPQNVLKFCGRTNKRIAAICRDEDKIFKPLLRHHYPDYDGWGEPKNEYIWLTNNREALDQIVNFVSNHPDLTIFGNELKLYFGRTSPEKLLQQFFSPSNRQIINSVVIPNNRAMDKLKSELLQPDYAKSSGWSDIIEDHMLQYLGNIYSTLARYRSGPRPTSDVVLVTKKDGSKTVDDIDVLKELDFSVKIGRKEFPVTVFVINGLLVPDLTKKEKEEVFVE